MTKGWRTFRRFWNAEEVPRWFGLSLVLVYLVGLGVVAHFGITQARREAGAYFQHSSEYAVRQLARNLSALESDGPEAPKRMGAYQRVLREFAANVPSRVVRIVDGQRRVIASINAAEIGSIAADPVVGSLRPGTLEVTPMPVPGQDQPDRWLRVPISPAEPLIPPADENSSPVVQEGGGLLGVLEPSDSPVALFLAVRLGPQAYSPSGLSQHAGMLTAVLVVLGALFVIYRRLREQLRSLWLIGDRLQWHGDGIRQDLASLHVADIRDDTTTAWNELIDLAQSLAATVERTEANEELSRVLKGSGGGALAEALNALPDGIMYITNEMRFEYVNSTVCRLFHWNVEEVRQMTLPEARASDVGGKVLDLLREAQQPDGSFEARTETLEADNGQGYDCSAYRVWVIPLRSTHREGECIVVIRDVSQQVRAEGAREEFVTQVTHELRTPLTNIRAYAETLSSGMFDDPKVITECYNVITKETRRLSRLIEDILSVSQLEVGSIELEMDGVDLKTLLSNGVQDIRGLADEKNIDVQLALPAKLEPIRADRDKLAVVINNLLGNAIKYTSQGGDVVVSCQMTDDAVAVTVKDNGIGIAPADHARVFEKFQRADDPAVKDEPGSGIGLFTAREIVRHHGGDIELLSEKGQGSTFIVRLPHQQSRATAMGTAHEA